MNFNSADHANFDEDIHDTGLPYAACSELPPMTSMPYNTFQLPDLDLENVNGGATTTQQQQQQQPPPNSNSACCTMDVELETEFANFMISSQIGEGENSTPLNHQRQPQQEQQQQYQPPHPLPIPEEVFEPSFRDRGITRSEALVIRYGTTTAVPTTIEIMKQQNPQQAYMRIKSWKSKSLSHGGPEWGKLYLGYIVERVDDNTTIPNDHDDNDGRQRRIPIFREPNEDQVQRVAIKRLLKQVLTVAKQNGDAEDPDCEIFRMNTIGDNRHVLSCIETLEDDNYLYIISPYAEGQTLAEHIPLKPSNGPISIENQARIIFHQLLEDLQYMHDSHSICHRDISPGNCLVHKDRVVLNDLAMSHRIPTPPSQLLSSSSSIPPNNNDTRVEGQQQDRRPYDWRRRGWIAPFGRFGKPPYWPPEVLIQPPEGVHAAGCDLWAAVVVLFNLLTGCNFYSFPHPDDRIFRFFVLCGGFAPNGHSSPLVERAWDELQAPDERRHRSHVVDILQRIQGLSPRVVELFCNVLKVNPHQRWSMDDVLNCSWMREGPY